MDTSIENSQELVTEDRHREAGLQIYKHQLTT